MIKSLMYRMLYHTNIKIKCSRYTGYHSTLRDFGTTSTISGNDTKQDWTLSVLDSPPILPLLFLGNISMSGTSMTQDDFGSGRGLNLTCFL